MRLSFLGLSLVLFIDGMGQGILFPILIRDLTNPESVVLTASQSMVFRNSLYGIVLGVFFFCWFIGAPILGDLSDYVGRKRALMICLWGTLIGYVFSAFAFIVHSILLLIIGRIIDGITAGGQPIAQAAAVDVSEEKTKTKNIGYVLLFLTLGIVCGPLIGGFLSDSKVVSWFDSTTPMYFAIILSFLNIVVLQFSYKDILPPKEGFQLNWAKAIESLSSIVRHKKICYLAFSFLVIQTGWAFYYFYISLFVAHQFGFSPLEVSFLFTLLGIGLCIGFAFLTKWFSGHSIKGVILIGYAILALMVFLTMVSESWLVWIIILPAAAAMSTAYAFYMTIFSKQVDETKQGWVMGVTGGMNSIAAGTSSILAGFLANVNIFLPLIISVILILIGILLTGLVRKKTHA